MRPPVPVSTLPVAVLTGALCPGLGDLRLSAGEAAWLAETCPFFTSDYLSYLSAFRFKPEQQVELTFVSDGTTAEETGWGSLELAITGGWLDTILYEVSPTLWGSRSARGADRACTRSL